MFVPGLFDHETQTGVRLPVHLCAQAVGSTVQVKAWATGAEPTWAGLPARNTVRLPAGWQHAGVVGWYAGHLGAGDELTYGDLTTWTGTAPGS